MGRRCEMSVMVEQVAIVRRRFAAASTEHRTHHQFQDESLSHESINRARAPPHAALDYTAARALRCFLTPSNRGKAIQYNG